MCDYQVDRIFSEKISVSTQNASQFAKDRPQLTHGIAEQTSA